ncbi:hypothetical protein HJG60_010688 [Phyllostomus discolor]|uniref:Uncharacterized protein n=1 Tax=Phyllostomus discolor TaxID=89673 RepID=A0A834EF52_9CHIR|nr:hypothetical protein HJG60_010688 [Phyllostomus discolor]
MPVSLQCSQGVILVSWPLPRGHWTFMTGGTKPLQGEVRPEPRVERPWGESLGEQRSPGPGQGWGAAGLEVPASFSWPPGFPLATDCSPGGLRLPQFCGLRSQCCSPGQEVSLPISLLTRAALQLCDPQPLPSDRGRPSQDRSPSSPGAALPPPPAREGVWGGREFRLSRTARPGQAGLETSNPHSGKEGRPGRPYRVPPPPFTHFPITTLVVSTVTPAGPASSNVCGRRASTSLLLQPQGCHGNCPAP